MQYMGYDHLTDLFRTKLSEQHSHIRNWDFQLPFLGTFQFKTGRGKNLCYTTVYVPPGNNCNILPYYLLPQKQNPFWLQLHFYLNPDKKKKIPSLSLLMYICLKKSQVTMLIQRQKNIYTYNQYQNQNSTHLPVQKILPSPFFSLSSNIISVSISIKHVIHTQISRQALHLLCIVKAEFLFFFFL